jgi:hypothetical protein
MNEFKEILNYADGKIQKESFNSNKPKSPTKTAVTPSDDI